MEDKNIVQLYLNREEAAIAETKEKYESYCYSIAFNVLHNDDDSKECVNDAYLRTWNSIPPNKPDKLSTYIGKITRNLAFDMYRKNHTEKRGSGEMPIVLDELADCISSNESVEGQIEKKELIKEINQFLSTLSKDQCHMFIMRYWYVMPIGQIAAKFNMTNGNVSIQLLRIRRSLREYLVKRGFEI